MPEKQKPPARDDVVRNFLTREYDALVGLYIHYENGISSLFNFYLTLLSTVAGATIVLFQIGTPTVGSILPAVGILILLALTLGIVVQEAILNKNVDLAYVTQAINLLKFEALKDDSDVHQYVDYLHNPFIRKNTTHAPVKFYTRLENRFWFLKWVGSHQLFISLFNSLELSFLVVVLVSMVAPGAIAIWRTVIACGVVLSFSLFAHATYANLEFQRRLNARTLRMSDYQKPPQLS